LNIQSESEAVRLEIDNTLSSEDDSSEEEEEGEGARNLYKDITASASTVYAMESDVFKWSKKFVNGKNFKVLQFRDACY
jgi:hypothetical protein